MDMRWRASMGRATRGARSPGVWVETAGIAPPLGLRALGEVGRVRLSWEASGERDLEGYNVYRSPRSDAGYVRLAGVEGTPFTTGEISYVDSSVAPGARYFYRVTAVTSRRESGLSGFVGAAVLADAVGPGSPLNLSAVAEEDAPGSVRLRWEAPRVDADGGELTGLSGYVVLRSAEEGASFVAIDTVLAGGAQLRGPGAGGAAPLWICGGGLRRLGQRGGRVRRGCGWRRGGIAPPLGLRALGEIGRIRLSWEASGERDLEGYNVYRSSRSDAGYARLAGGGRGAVHHGTDCLHRFGTGRGRRLFLPGQRSDFAG